MVRKIATIISCAASIACISQASAQDKITTQTETIEGAIVGVTSDGSPKIQSAKGIAAVNKSQIVRIEMKEPAEVAKARQAAASGDSAGVVSALGAKAMQFIGLDVLWVKESVALLSDAYIASGKKAEAKALFEAVEKNYKGTPDEVQAQVGKARLAVEEKNYPAAEQILNPIIEKAKGQVLPPVSEHASVVAAFYAMGQLLEAQGKKNEAMECYAKIGSLYPASQAQVTQAASRMKSLRESSNAFVP